MMRRPLPASRMLRGWSLSLICLLCAGLARGADLGAPASWSPPAASDVQEELENWLSQRDATPLVRESIAALWAVADEETTGDRLLDLVVQSLALVEDDARRLVAFCRQSPPHASLPTFPLLEDESAPPLVRGNLRVYWGAWLARHDMHEEALAVLAGIEPNDVADPAALLFHQAVCHHRLRQKEACLPLLARLLENEAATPRRYRELAHLMRADLAPLKPDSLDDIARLMDSVRRRLDLARVGKRVREEEDEVIAKLDKLIDDLEKQREEQPPDGSPMDGQQPSRPQDDSSPGSERGKGDVDPRRLGEYGKWGNLPPKERQEALQQISKELPAHYREAVEEYFRKLARDNEPSNEP